jgi:hypothetical protein
MEFHCIARSGGAQRRLDRAPLAENAAAAREGAMVQMVGIGEINRIFEVTDRLGIHREAIVIPLAPRHPGRVRKRPDGKIEIVVESEGDFEAWAAGLEAEIQKAIG